jgi:two-component system response regulator
MRVDLPPILVVEDNHEDYDLLSRILSKLNVQNPLYRLILGPDALDYLSRRLSHQKRQSEPMPVLITVDVRLPWMEGDDLIRAIREREEFAGVPIVVISDMQSPKVIEKCLSAGASAFVPKSTDYETFTRDLGSAILPHLSEALPAEGSTGSYVL